MHEITNPAILASIAGGMSPPPKFGDTPVTPSAPDQNHGLASCEAIPEISSPVQPQFAQVPNGMRTQPGLSRFGFRSPPRPPLYHQSIR